MLSVVIPSYNEAGLVLPAAQTIGTILAEAHIEYDGADHRDDFGRGAHRI